MQTFSFFSLIKKGERPPPFKLFVFPVNSIFRAESNRFIHVGFRINRQIGHLNETEIVFAENIRADLQTPTTQITDTQVYGWSFA